LRFATLLCGLLSMACADAPDAAVVAPSPPEKVELVSVTAPEVLATVRQLDAKVVVLNFWQTT